jgi:hypothetical protein
MDYMLVRQLRKSTGPLRCLLDSNHSLKITDLRLSDIRIRRKISTYKDFHGIVSRHTALIVSGRSGTDLGEKTSL